MAQASRKNLRELAGVLLLTVVVFCLGAVLPSAGSEVYGSPDETANAVVAQTIERLGVGRIRDPIIQEFAFLHPRSFVSVQGAGMVPVGFLGMPWLLAQLTRMLPFSFMKWIGACAAASMVWPFFQLLRRRFSVAASFLATVLASFWPATLYYANRGLFAQVPLLAAALWAGYFVDRLAREAELTGWKRWATAFGFGVLLVLALAIRPIEAIWILPWIVWLGWKWRPTGKEVAASCVGIGLVTVPLLWTTALTYGSPFAIGYWLRDYAPASAVPSASASVPPSFWQKYLPYGFHPRHILHNVRAFGFGVMWPWMLGAVGIAGMAAASGIWRRWRSAEGVAWMLAAWSLGVLLVVYGSGLYQDNIQLGAITMGNSFLRYLLPAGLLFAIGAAWVTDYLPKKTWVMGLVLVATAGLCGVGVWHAFFADDEGIWKMRREVVRYAEIREAAGQWLKSGDPVFSERSDKVFFPTYYGVSPMPALETVADLLRKTKGQAGLFVRPLSQSQKDAWHATGLDIRELASFGRERLYLLRLP